MPSSHCPSRRTLLVYGSQGRRMLHETKRVGQAGELLKFRLVKWWQIKSIKKRNTWVWKRAHALDCFGGLEPIACLTGLKLFTSGLSPRFSQREKISSPSLF